MFQLPLQCLRMIFTLGVYQQKDSALFLFPSYTWKLFLVVWVLCNLWIINSLSGKEHGKGRTLIIINSAKANNILG